MYQEGWPRRQGGERPRRPRPHRGARAPHLDSFTRTPSASSARFTTSSAAPPARPSPPGATPSTSRGASPSPSTSTARGAPGDFKGHRRPRARRRRRPTPPTTPAAPSRWAPRSPRAMDHRQRDQHPRRAAAPPCRAWRGLRARRPRCHRRLARPPRLGLRDAAGAARAALPPRRRRHRAPPLVCLDLATTVSRAPCATAHRARRRRDEGRRRGVPRLAPAPRGQRGRLGPRPRLLQLTLQPTTSARAPVPASRHRPHVPRLARRHLLRDERRHGETIRPALFLALRRRGPLEFFHRA